MSLPSLAAVEHADWPALKAMAVDLGLNPKGRSEVVRWRVLDHVRRRTRPEPWKPDARLQAALLTHLGFPEPAARIWESRIELDAPGPWIGLGRAQLLAGDLEEASKSFDRAAEMGDAGAHLHRAETLAASGKWEASVRACDSYLAARPRDLRGRLLKASFLARGGWTEEAATVLRETFEAHPRLHELWRGLGTVLLKGGRSEAAAEAFLEATRADPKDADAWTNRGVAQFLLGRNREAIGALRETLEIDPKNAVALNDLGMAYLRAGQAKSAIVNFERAARHLETPQILLSVAMAHEAAAQRRAALEMYRRVLRVKPRDAEALAGVRRLMPPKSAKLAAKRVPPPKPRKAPSKRRLPRRRRPARRSRRGKGRPGGRVAKTPSRKPRRPKGRKPPRGPSTGRRKQIRRRGRR